MSKRKREQDLGAIKLSLISQAFCIRYLEVLKINDPPSLNQFKWVMRGGLCWWCGGMLASELGHEDASEGWKVQGFKQLQKLTKQCSQCQSVFTLSMLGVPENI